MLARAFLGYLGRSSLETLVYIARMGRLAVASLYWIFVAPFTVGKPVGRARIAARMLETGPATAPIVSLIMFLTGMVLAMQMAYQLRDFGMEGLTPGAVAVTICREIGPLLTAIVIAARVGASITAELGTMAVSEEVTALEVMAIDPVRYLVAPRLIAMTIMTPALTVLSIYVGILGGMSIGVSMLGMTAQGYFSTSLEMMKFVDLATGMTKSVVFGVLIGLVACHEGLSVQGGAAGVGQATTRCVVVSILFIIICDLIFTLLFFI